MTYRIYKFGDVNLPDRMPEDNNNSGDVESSLFDSIGGVFDMSGDYHKKPRSMQIPFDGIYIGETIYEVDEAGNHIVDEAGNRIIWGSKESVLNAKVSALMACNGKRDSLWRRREVDDAEQWKTARLMNADYRRKLDDAGIVANVIGMFETRHAGWHDETQTTDTATFTASGIQQLDVDNGGEMRVDDAQVVITSGTGGYTSVRVQCVANGIDWTFGGATAATGAVRTIDCDVGTVRSGSDADLYDEFVRNSGHTARGWLPLDVGKNQLIITMVGAGTVAVKHYGQYP